MSAYEPDAFDAYEAAGWEAVAARYDAFWSPLTAEVVDALLDAAGVRSGLRVLDVGTGSGAAAGRAAGRGAQATGVDVAAAMIAVAARHHPAAKFVQASVTELPFAGESFDAAVGNIVIQHIGEPERAVRELERVLAPDGGVALSTWAAPDRSPFFAAVLGAVGDAEVPAPTGLPSGPAFFQFADGAAFTALLVDAGFDEVEIDDVALELRLRSAEELIAALEEGTVRTGALLREADDAQRRRLRESLESRLEPLRRGELYAVPAPVRIAHGRKPS